MSKPVRPGNADDVNLDSDQADTELASESPLLPGTEKPRSLGQIFQEARLRTASPADGEQSVKTKNTRSGKKTSRSRARRNARERALQALYQWDISDAESALVRSEFLESQDMSRVDIDYFNLLFIGISDQVGEVDAVMQTGLDRPLADLDPIERAVLRIATFELTQQPSLPARVIINEGIEITKRFGADKGHRYVNGVLDKLAAQFRGQEMKSNQ